jgi:hypothetical protein
MQAGRLTVLKHLECIANSDANRLFAEQLAATMLARFKEAGNFLICFGFRCRVSME